MSEQSLKIERYVKVNRVGASLVIKTSDDKRRPFNRPTIILKFCTSYQPFIFPFFLCKYLAFYLAFHCPVDTLHFFVLYREDMGFKLVAEQVGRVPTLDVFCSFKRTQPF